jgi:NitT/TauT family transport system substrate-binding protein
VVEQLVAAGVAHVAVSMGEATGPVPFTSCMTSPEFLTRERDVVLRFTRAIFRTQRWLAGREPADIARVVGPAFPDIAPDILVRGIGRFVRQDTWARDPLLRRSGFDYLQEILLSGGFITRSHRYEDLVDTACAQEVMAAADAG